MRHLRSGGMAEVYEAVHEHLDITSALKLLSPTSEDDPQMVGRFLQEGRALAQVDHPGVVRVQHCEKLDGGPPYVAMEHLHGTSLRDHLRQQGRLSWEDAVALARQVADAMAAVHALGIVHRDLKPENLFLVEPRGPAGRMRVKVLDFGISKVPASQRVTVDTQVQTSAPAMLGTPIYMAPEQCRNPTSTTDRADVYALGVVLYELLAGRPPFLGDEPLDVMTQHLLAQPEPLRTLAPEVPAELDALIRAMLDKEPQRRPAMAHLAEEFSRCGATRSRRRSLSQSLRALWQAARGHTNPNILPTSTGYDPCARHESLERAALAWELAGRPSLELPDGTLLADYAVRPPSPQTITGRPTSERAQRFMAAAQRAWRIRRRARFIFAAVTAACMFLAIGGGLAALRGQQHSSQLCLLMLKSAEQELSNYDWELAQMPHSVDMRRDKLRMLEQQLRTSPEPCDALTVRRTLIVIQHQRGDLELNYGTPAEAAPFYEAARAALDSETPGPELAREWQFLLAMSDSKQGKQALVQGAVSEAQELIDRSVQRLEGLWRQYRDEETQRSLATGYSEQAQIAQLQGSWDRAAALYAQQVDLLSELAHEDYDDALLVLALGSYAEAAAQSGDELSARRSLARGFLLGKRLVLSKSENLFYRWGLARLYMVDAALESATGRHAEAEVSLAHALSIGRELHRVEGSHRGYSRFLAQAIQQAEHSAQPSAPIAQVREERCRLIAALAQRTPDDPGTRRLLCP
ncbi:MAG: serine/threonine-protein kinase [Polyangia bacterium]